MPILKYLSAEQSVHRVLAACCADSSRVPLDLVAAQVQFLMSADRVALDNAYLEIPVSGAERASGFGRLLCRLVPGSSRPCCRPSPIFDERGSSGAGQCLS